GADGIAGAGQHVDDPHARGVGKRLEQLGRRSRLLVVERRRRERRAAGDHGHARNISTFIDTSRRGRGVLADAPSETSYVWTVFRVFSAATSTGFGSATKSSGAVNFDCWPCVSAQKTSFRSSAAWDVCCGRITYV